MSDENAAWKFLRKQEWSMGNGQCPECHSMGPSWLGIGGWGTLIGHRRGCSMAVALEAVGQHVVHEMRYDRKPSDNFLGPSFGQVDWESEATQALCAEIEKAHPGVFLAKPPK